MSKQVPWNTVIYSRFVELAMLNETEKYILKPR